MSQSIPMKRYATILGVGLLLLWATYVTWRLEGIMQFMIGEFCGDKPDMMAFQLPGGPEYQCPNRRNAK